MTSFSDSTRRRARVRALAVILSIRVNARFPNILLAVVDCARSDKWLGPHRPTRTPNFDRFAGGAIRLPTCIVEKACTTPSFTTLLTGRYSPRHGVHLVWGYRLPESVPLLPQAFAAHGYNTYAEVSGPLLPEMGLARGFHKYEYRAPCDYLHTAWGDRFVERLRSGFYQPPWFILLHIWELHPRRYVAPSCNTTEFGRDGYERAISSLDAQLPRLFDAAGEDALIVFTGDHGEKTQFEEYRSGTAVDYARTLLKIDQADGMAPFGVAGWAGPSVLQEMYAQCTPLMRRVRLRDGAAGPRFDRWSRLRDRLRMLRLTPFVYFTDLLKLGMPLKLTEMLKRRGLLDADRAKAKVASLTRAVGQERLLDMHMRMWTNSYKHNMIEGHLVHVYDFLVRVPLVLRLPANAECRMQNAEIPSATIERMVRQPDILPTILELIGVGNPGQPPKSDPFHVDAACDGRSFGSLLRGDAWSPPPAFLSVSGCPADLEIRGVRTEDWKYTFGPENDELPQELYDLRRDPHEVRNLAAERQNLCRELRAAANAFVGEAGPLEEMTLAAGDQSRVEKQLRELGYIE